MCRLSLAIAQSAVCCVNSSRSCEQLKRLMCALCECALRLRKCLFQLICQFSQSVDGAHILTFGCARLACCACLFSYFRNQSMVRTLYRFVVHGSRVVHVSFLIFAISRWCTHCTVCVCTARVLCMSLFLFSQSVDDAHIVPFVCARHACHSFDFRKFGKWQWKSVQLKFRNEAKCQS